MCDLRIVAPARASDVLALAGPMCGTRKALIAQKRACQTVAIHDTAGNALAVGHFLTVNAGRTMFALQISRDAAPAMRPIVRLARLTLAGIAETGTTIWTDVHPANRQGERMALLAGFRRTWVRDPNKMVWRG